MKDLLHKYTGRVADDYNERRSRSNKWAFETTSVESLICDIDITTILDCPVGTGRFWNLYKNRNISATGLDVSHDMLRVARGVWGGTLIPGDMFTYDFGSQRFDCVLCVRFLNWLNFTDASIAIRILSDLSDRYFIASFSSSKTHFTTNNGVHIHDIDSMRSSFRECGFRIVRRFSMMSSSVDAISSVCLLKRGSFETLVDELFYLLDFHSHWRDTSSTDTLRRLATKAVGHSMSLTKYTVIESFYETSDFVKIKSKRRCDMSPRDINAPVILMRHNGRLYVLDGQARINMFISNRNAHQHRCLVVEQQ